MKRLWLACAVSLALAVPVAAQESCTKRWNSVLKEWDITCTDGSTGSERYNPVLKEWESELRPGWQRGDPFAQPQRCTTRWNSVLREYETECR